MEPPKIPDNESRRMTALKKLNILDTPIQESFERITRITKALFDVPIVSFTLVDSDRQWFKSVQGLDLCEGPRKISFCGHVINQDELFIINDTHLDPRFADNPYVTGEPHIRFYAGYPVHAEDGSKIGSLCLIDTKPRDFKDSDLTQLKDMAAMIENELSSKRARTIQDQLHDELAQAKKQAMVDGLTRLWNRSGIEELMKKQMALAEQNKENFGLAIIDIDNFKSINDTYGHNAGDSILRAVAKRLLRGYRSTDSVGRWGGEEFLVIMDGNTEADNFFDAAERARNVISSEPITFDNLKITITVTTGLSSFNWETPCEIVKLVGAADQALYEGKNKGKNVVKVSLTVTQNKP